MKAIILNETGETDKLVYTEIPIPDIKDNEVLVAVKAISINPVDVKTRHGDGIYEMIKDKMPIILGWDIAGIVTKVGGNVHDLKIGDEVCGMINFPGLGNAYAEYVAVPAEQLAFKPKNKSLEEAVAATMTAQTAWQALVTNAHVKKGDKVLIHAASGGVGHIAVQIAKHLGAYVIGTSSVKNRDFVLSLGADEHIDYRSLNFEDIVSDVDVVLDTIGGSYIERSLKVVKSGGTLISIPTDPDEDVKEKAKKKEVSCYFILVTSNGADQREIVKLVEDGIIKPHISTVYSFDKMAKAHQQIESGRTVGKVVVKI